MKPGQTFCRGAVVLHSGRPSLIVAVTHSGAVVVPLRPACIPRYRADISLTHLAGVLHTTARCAEASYEKFACLRVWGQAGPACFGMHDMQRVDDAIRRERVAQAEEELPPGIVTSTCQPFFGSRGRKVGGPPSG